MKSRDFEPKLRPFLKVFEKITYRQDVYRAYQDFIVICLNYFGNGQFIEERDEAMKRYSAEEKQLFNELFEELIKLMSQEITDNKSWFDPFGNFYQAITSNWKASAMGQFFTPETVVDFMVQIIYADRSESKMMFCQAEPTSGSGRFILAAHVYNPMGFYWAVDLDPMCAQMTAINMALHNCCGVVLQTNGLWEEHEFKRAYHVARIQLNETTFVPCIYPIDTYKEAKDIFTKYQEFAHYNNLAYHFREYMGLKPREQFDEQKVLEAVEENFKIPEEPMDDMPAPPEITPKIKEVIKERVKITNNQLKDQQLKLF